MSWMDSKEQFDDITMLAFDYNGKKETESLWKKHSM